MGRVQGMMSHVTANDFMHVGALARHSPVNICSRAFRFDKGV